MAIIDEFHRAIAMKIQDEIANRMAGLAAGSAMALPEDKASTAEKYAAGVSYIHALNQVMAMCEEISDERFGRQPEQQQEA